MKPIQILLCVVMAIRSLKRYYKTKSPIPLMLGLFWIHLLFVTLTYFLWFLLPALVFLVLAVLGRRFPFHAIAWQSRISMLCSKGRNRQVDELFAEIPKLVKASNKVLHQKLTHSNADIQSLAIRELAERKDTSIVDPLMKMLEDGASKDNRYVIIEALGQLEDPRAATAIAPYVSHEEDFIRKESLNALKRLANDYCVPHILNQLKFEKRHELVTLGLQTLFTIQALDAFKANWQNIPDSVKMVYMDAIYKIEDDRRNEIISFLPLALNDDSMDVRKKAQSIKHMIQLNALEKKHGDIFPKDEPVKTANCEGFLCLDKITDTPLLWDIPGQGCLRIAPGNVTYRITSQLPGIQRKANAGDY